MKSFFLILGLIFLISAFSIFANYRPTLSSAITELSSTNLPEATPNIGLPIKLIIPKISVDTSIESVSLDAKGNMDVPKDADQVGWYNLGYKPGQKGSAVLAGHLDRANGKPAIFYKLNDLKPKDEITIIDEYQQKYTYIVTDINTYNTNEFPLDEIFAANDKTRLNLITCAGKFNNQNQNYSHRTVVKTELKTE